MQEFKIEKALTQRLKGCKGRKGNAENIKSIRCVPLRLRASALRLLKSVECAPYSVGGMLLLATSTLSLAQTYPAKPVRLIIPFPPGSSTNDILGRALALRLSESLGLQFVVDNRPGVGGNLGSEIAAKAVPDGYTLLIGTNGPIGISPHIYKSLGYDPLKDLAPVTLYAMVPYAIIVHASVKASNLTDLIALAKAAPGKLNYASPGSGSTPDRKSTRLNSSHVSESRMPSSA